MPARNYSSAHDDAGIYGFDTINKILSNFDLHVYKDGKLYMLVFDFIYPLVIDACIAYNLKCKVKLKAKRLIRKGGKTEKNLKHIKEIFPEFKPILKPNGEMWHYIKIIEIYI